MLCIKLPCTSSHKICHMVGEMELVSGPYCRSPGYFFEEREFFIVNLLVQIHFIIEMIRWTGFAPWEFESPFPGSRTSTSLVHASTPH